MNLSIVFEIDSTRTWTRRVIALDPDPGSGFKTRRVRVITISSFKINSSSIHQNIIQYANQLELMNLHARKVPKWFVFATFESYRELSSHTNNCLR